MESDEIVATICYGGDGKKELRWNQIGRGCSDYLNPDIIKSKELGVAASNFGDGLTIVRGLLEVSGQLALNTVNYEIPMDETDIEDLYGQLEVVKSEFPQSNVEVVFVGRS